MQTINDLSGTNPVEIIRKWDYHTLSTEELVKRFKTNEIKGLSIREAARRRSIIKEKISDLR